MITALLEDFRHAARSLSRQPTTLVFAAGAIALGIGATTAVFSIVDRFWFRPLPYAHTSRLVWLGMRAPIAPAEFLLEEGFHDLRTHQAVFEEVASFNFTTDCDLTERNPSQVRCAYVSHNLLDTLGIPLQAGRGFTTAEDTPNGPLAALLSDALWRTRYGADPAVLGRTLSIDGRAAVVAGILPSTFELPNVYRADILLPQQLKIEPGVSRSLLTVFARLKPGVTLDQARTALRPIFQEMLKRVPAQFARDVKFEASALDERRVRLLKPQASAVLGIVFLVLLIACFNAANLLLARLAARSREWAVRAAVGASRGRIARQLACEGLVVAAVGAVGGIALAHPFMRGLISLAPADLPLKVLNATLDARVLVFALLLTGVCGLLTSLLPVLRTPGPEVLRAGATAGGGFRLRHMMVAVQVAMSCVLLSCAGLRLRNLWDLQRMDLGFRPDQVAAAEIQLPRYRYTQPRQRGDFYERALENVRGLPGVAEAAPVTAVPVTGSGATTLFAALVPEGRTVDPGMGTGGRVSTRGVTPGYFSVMGIPIVRGRAFEPADRTSSDRIAILDETLARRLFPNEDAVGKRFRWGSQYTVIGISRPARNTPMMVGNEPELYTVWKQGDGGNRTAAVMVRAAGDPAAVGRMIHAQVAAIDAEAPVTVSTLSQALGRVLRPARVTSLVVGSFALAGLLLTALGQFGVISQLVTQRRREIGIRIAVGARPEDAAGLVLRQALVWTAVGAALGIAGAIAAARPVNVAFPGPAQTVTGPLIAALVVLGGVSLLAAWRPAARAARVNPVEVLRCD